MALLDCSLADGLCAALLDRHRLILPTPPDSANGSCAAITSGAGAPRDSVVLSFFSSLVVDSTIQVILRAAKPCKDLL